jgi:hypothetical protein
MTLPRIRGLATSCFPRCLCICTIFLMGGKGVVVEYSIVHLWICINSATESVFCQIKSKHSAFIEICEHVMYRCLNPGNGHHTFTPRHPNPQTDGGNVSSNITEEYPCRWLNFYSVVVKWLDKITYTRLGAISICKLQLNYMFVLDIL